MLKGKSIIARSFIIPSSFVLILLMLGYQNTNGQTNFNGGFEIKSNYFNAPEGWATTRVPETAVFHSFEWDSTEKHSGSYSISVEISANHPEDKIAYNWTRAFDEFKTGQNYELSCWVKTKDLEETAWIVVQFWGENQKWLGMNSNQFWQPIKGTNDWTLIKFAFTVPEETKEVRIRAGIASPADKGGKVWFDDIKIE